MLARLDLFDDLGSPSSNLALAASRLAGPRARTSASVRRASAEAR